MSYDTIGDRWGRSPISVPLTYILGGIAVGVAMLTLDAVAGLASGPVWLWVSPDVARSSLVGLVTSFLFVISVVFWVRIWAVQITAGSLPNRLLSQFLTDRVQQHAMGFLIGGIAYVLTVLRALPNGATGRAVPHLAVTFAYVDALAVAVVIVWVIHNAVEASQIGGLVHRITGEAVGVIRRTHPELRSGGMGVGERPPATPAGGGHVVHADVSGWVQDISEDGLLDGSPPGSTVELAVRVGSFVLEGQRLATLWPADASDAEEFPGGGAFSIVDEPSRRDNVAYALNELVDVARRSVAPGSSDLTSARDAVLHLGVVIRELLIRDLPPATRVTEDGRRLIRGQQLTFDDYCEASLGRVRDVVGGSRELLTILLATIREISDQLSDYDVPDRQDLLREHARLTVQQARQNLSLPHNFERVASRARAAGVDLDDIQKQ